MPSMKENSTKVVAETPAEGFQLYEESLSWAEYISEDTHVDRYDNGDELILKAWYVNPEGEQVDVDAFRATAEELEILLCFDIELPID